MDQSEDLSGEVQSCQGEGVREVQWSRFLADIGNGKVLVTVVNRHLFLVLRQRIKKHPKYGEIEMVIKEPIRLIE